MVFLYQEFFWIIAFFYIILWCLLNRQTLVLHICRAEWWSVYCLAVASLVRFLGLLLAQMKCINVKALAMHGSGFSRCQVFFFSSCGFFSLLLTSFFQPFFSPFFPYPCIRQSDLLFLNPSALKSLPKFLACKPCLHSALCSLKWLIPYIIISVLDRTCVNDQASLWPGLTSRGWGPGMPDKWPHPHATLSVSLSPRPQCGLEGCWSSHGKCVIVDTVALWIFCWKDGLVGHRFEAQ